MLTRILVALDGSNFSEVALDLGIEWAKRFNAQLVGLGIVDEPTIRSHEPVPIGGAAYKVERDEFRMAEARGKVDQFLDDFTRRCTETGVSCKTLEDVGLPSKEILRESHRYDLVLLGHETHFHFETEDKADETLWRVLRHESRPVVIAPPKLKAGSSVLVALRRKPSGRPCPSGIPDIGPRFRAGGLRHVHRPNRRNRRSRSQ